MNIFHLDPCPKSAAEMLCDKHVPKMLLESCQMLCTGYQKHAGVNDTLYKPAYVNHPMTIWVGHSKQNWLWLFEHATAIAEQYTLRYNRIHKSQRILSLLWLMEAEESMPDIGFTSPPQCMPDEYKVQNNYIKGYRNYYLGEKIRFAKWQKGVQEPEWWTEALYPEAKSA